METALNEITLVLFTSIAPAGVIGFIMMAWVALSTADKSRADAASRHLVIPLALAITGLIASATHLGTPANALYVISGIGRSPLSNEVVAAVAFLAIGGVYWIASFRDDMPKIVRRIWLAAASVAGVAFVTFIALAYSVSSVPTWNLPIAPLTLWLCGLSSGPFVGLFGLLFAKQEPTRLQMRTALGIAAVAAVANVAALAAEWGELGGIATTIASAVELVPFFPASIIAYAALNAGAIVVATLSPRLAETPRLIAIAAAALLALAACFAVRFVFYSMHMTVGI